MILHDIRNANPSAWVWVYWTGGNGRIVGDTEHYVHLVEHQRAQPPELPNPNRPRQPWEWGRQYWQPWNYVTNAQATDALCHSVRTRARWQYAHFPGLWIAHRCPACLQAATARGINPEDVQTINNQDPWFQIPADQRATAIDPVTGL